MRADAAIVATRRTFDSVVIRVHANGELSDRMNYVRGGKLPTARLFRAADDICLYEYAELPAWIRQWNTERPPIARRIGTGRMDPLILQRQREHIMYNRSTRRRPGWFS